MTIPIPTFKAGLAGFASLLTLSGCASAPTPSDASVHVAADQPFLGLSAPYATPDAAARDWWRLFEDPILNALIEDALSENKDLAVAAANLDRAQAALRESRSARLPDTRIDAGASYGQTAEVRRSPGAPEEDWTYESGLTLAYEVDLSGRVRNAIRAARADAEAAKALTDAVTIQVIAQTVRAYADAAAAAERLEAASRTLDLLDESVRLIDSRYEAGFTSKLDLSRTMALREQQRATLPPLRALRDAALFRLATLTGRAPADLPEQAGARLTTLRLTQPLPVGDGASLLARRPDIREAERRLASSTARIGVATADLYPRISLGASAGAVSNDADELFTQSGFRWSAGPLISWTFPNQAAGRARIAAAKAEERAALARFDGAVLTALQEVETALSAYAHAHDRRTALAAALDQAREAARITRAQLREGGVDQLALLDSERTLASAEADFAEAKAVVVASQIDLFRALGGGWETADVKP